MSKKIKILVITERRADYSRFKPILEIIKKDRHLDYCLIVTGLHLLKEHGKTIKEIKRDGFKISHTIKMFDNTYKGNGASMVKSMGNVLKIIPQILSKSKPDLILAGFDIGANFSILGPPGNPKPNIFDVLSKASPRASSIVVPILLYLPRPLTTKN